MTGNQNSHDVRASILVPTSGRRALVERLLDAVSRQTGTPSAFEVIVVADGATDGTIELVEGYPAPFALRCLAQPSRGRAAACNAAIDAARGELLVILDDDMQPVPGWLEAHLDAHDAALRRCVMGAVPVVLDADSAPLQRWIHRSFDEHGAKLAQPGHVFTLADFYSGNTSIRRDVLREVGGFDDEFVEYGNEDVDLYARLRAAGVEPLYSAAACAAQEYHKAFGAYARDSRAAGRTAVLFARKHPEYAVELVHFRGGRGVWRRVNGALLWASRRTDLIYKVIVALEPIVARAGPENVRDAFYRRAENFFFWLGANEEQRGGETVLRR